MNHFEAHLIVSARDADFKVLGMASKYEKKGKMVKVMSEILDSFSSM